MPSMVEVLCQNGYGRCHEPVAMATVTAAIATTVMATVTVAMAKARRWQGTVMATVTVAMAKARRWQGNGDGGPRGLCELQSLFTASRGHAVLELRLATLLPIKAT